MKSKTANQNPKTLQFTNSRTRTALVENWEKKPGINADMVIDPDADSASALVAYVIANRDFEVLGTNATTACVTFADGGGITLTTLTTANDQVIVLPHLDTAQSSWAATKWNTSDSPAISARVVTGASIAATTIWYGLKLTNTSVVATDADQAMIRYDAATNSGKFQAVYSVGGTDYTLDTGVTAAASTVYDFDIDVDDDRVPRFFINGELVATGTALTDNIDLIPYVGVQTTTTAAKALTVRPNYAASKDQAD